MLQRDLGGGRDAEDGRRIGRVRHRRRGYGRRQRGEACLTRGGVNVSVMGDAPSVVPDRAVSPAYPVGQGRCPGRATSSADARGETKRLRPTGGPEHRGTGSLPPLPAAERAHDRGAEHLRWIIEVGGRAAECPSRHAGMVPAAVGAMFWLPAGPWRSGRSGGYPLSHRRSCVAPGTSCCPSKGRAGAAQPAGYDAASQVLDGERRSHPETFPPRHARRDRPPWRRPFW
jgi:hypothetical protein